MSDKRLQIQLDEKAAAALAATAASTGMTESDIVRAALKLAEEVGLDDDARLLKPLASPDWPWPDWWGPLCEKLEQLKNNGQSVETGTGVRNKILAIDPHGGSIELHSERSRSGKPRTITVRMLRHPENATTHGVIVRMLRSLADALPHTGAPSRKTGWYGAYRVSTLLDACIEDAHEWPADHLGVYLVSPKPWSGVINTV